MSKVYSFLWDESGTTAIEYALIAGSISIVFLVAAQSIGTTVNLTFTKVENGLQEGAFSCVKT